MLLVSGSVRFPGLPPEQDGQVVDGDQVLVHGRLAKLPVDHHPSGAGQVGTEEELE